jgi:thiol-disulfide isomerase/thioredoxin
MSLRRLVLHAVLAGALGASAAAAPGPLPAAQALDAAAKSAKAGSRNLLVLFHASWCSWCRKLEAVLATPAAKEVLDRHYERVELTVLERGERKATENPGAGDLLDKLSGGESGLPFVAVLDRKTRAPLATSNLAGPGTNVGFPAKADEVDHFVGMLRKGAPKMSEAEAETIRGAFPKR